MLFHVIPPALRRRGDVDQWKQRRKLLPIMWSVRSIVRWDLCHLERSASLVCSCCWWWCGLQGTRVLFMAGRRRSSTPKQSSYTKHSVPIRFMIFASEKLSADCFCLLCRHSQVCDRCHSGNFHCRSSLCSAIKTPAFLFMEDPKFWHKWAITLEKYSLCVMQEVYIWVCTTTADCKHIVCIAPHQTVGPTPPLLTWQVVQKKLPWGIVLLLGGGFALAKGSEVSRSHNHNFNGTFNLAQ